MVWEINIFKYLIKKGFSEKSALVKSFKVDKTLNPQ